MKVGERSDYEPMLDGEVDVYQLKETHVVDMEDAGELDTAAAAVDGKMAPGQDDIAVQEADRVEVRTDSVAPNQGERM